MNWHEHVSVHRIESGQKGQLKFKPNEKSKEDTVYAQGCDLLPQFFREAEDYLFESYRNFENISSTVFKELQKTHSCSFLFEYGLDLLSGLLGLC